MTRDSPGPAGLDRREATRGAVRIAYTVGGSGPAMVLLPSLGRGAEDFDALVPPLLAAGLRVLCPEPRGIGGSTPLAPGDTLHDMAADVAAVIEHDGAAPVLAVGHAAGNWVARMLAHDRPGLVRGVALLAAIVVAEPPPDMRRSITASLDTALPARERLEHLRHAYFAPGNDASSWLAGWHTAVGRAQREAAAATPDHAWRRTADHLPLLYLAARHDAISPPPTLRELRGAVGPRASLRVVEGAGHALLPERPAATAAALIAWAGSLAPNAAS